jgi:N-acetylneuraminic acid mutarotase
MKLLATFFTRPFTVFMVIHLSCLTVLSFAQNNSWTYKAPMPTSRGFTSGAVVNEKIYVIGGFPTHTSVTPANEMYDPATDSWTKMADMPEGRCANAICAYKGKIYVFGGVSSNPYASATNSIFVYDPQTDSWTQKTNMPYKNAFCGIAVVNDTIYLTGGMQGYASPPISSLWAYVPLTDSWTEKAPMPTARGMLSACALNGKIYAIGGTLNFLTSSFDIVEVYDPETNIWTTEIPMPTSRVSLATCVLKDEIYAVGGYDYPLMYALNETYNPELDEWTTKAPMQETRQTFFLGAVGDKIYAIGGSYPNPQNPAMPVILNSVEEFNIMTTGVENRHGEEGHSNQLKLGQNYPNPFSSTTTIPYELFHQTHVKLSVYDLLGRKVSIPVNQNQPPGKYQVAFSGEKLARGIYYYQIQAKSEYDFQFSDTRKFILIK